MEAELLKSLSGLFIGVTVAGALWGISTSQVFHYYTTRPKDVMWIKVLVGTVWAFDTTLQLIIVILLYDYSVANFGNVIHLLEVPSTATPNNTIMAFQAMMVQSFYVSKIWILSRRSKLLMTFIGTLMATELGFAIFLIYTSATSGKTWDAVLASQEVSGVAFASAGFVIDCVITVTLSTLLHRSKTEYSQTNSMIGRLIIFFASTNLLTALGQLAALVVYVVYPKEFYVIPLGFVVDRLYANSLLAALNMRPYIQNGHRVAFQSTEPTSISMTDVSPAHKGGVRVVHMTSTHYDTGHELGSTGTAKQDHLV